MAEKPKPNPKKKGEQGEQEIEEKVLPTPQPPEVPEEGTEGDQPPKKEPKGDKLPPEPVDYKKKFADSTREVQRIQKESKQDKEKITELEAQLKSKPPSDEELAKKYPDWDILDETEKEKLRKGTQTDKRLRKLEEAKAWEEDYKSLIKQEEFSELAGQEDEFKEFAYKYPKEVDLPTLARSYLYEKGKKKVETPEEPPERPGLEKATPGRDVVPPEEMTLEDVKRLRTTQPKLYLKMIREGKIKKISEK